MTLPFKMSTQQFVEIRKKYDSQIKELQDAYRTGHNERQVCRKASLEALVDPSLQDVFNVHNEHNSIDEPFFREYGSKVFDLEDQMKKDITELDVGKIPFWICTYRIVGGATRSKYFSDEEKVKEVQKTRGKHLREVERRYLPELYGDYVEYLDDDQFHERFMPESLARLL